MCSRATKRASSPGWAPRSTPDPTRLAHGGERPPRVSGPGPADARPLRQVFAAGGGERSATPILCARPGPESPAARGAAAGAAAGGAAAAAAATPASPRPDTPPLEGHVRTPPGAGPPAGFPAPEPRHAELDAPEQRHAELDAPEQRHAELHMAPRAEPRASPPGEGAGGGRSPGDARGGMSAGDFLLYCLGRLRQVRPAGFQSPPPLPTVPPTRPLPYQRVRGRESPHQPPPCCPYCPSRRPP